MAGKKKGNEVFGTIDRRGEGCQFRARIWLNGKRCSKTFVTEAAAEAWLKAKRAESLRPDRATRELQATELTLADALELRLDHISGAKNHRNEKYAVKRLKEDFPDLCKRSMYDIDEVDIRDFVAARRKQVAAATVNRDVSMLSHTFNLARTQFGCTKLPNPIGPTSRIKLPSGRVRRLSAEEENALLRQAELYEAKNSIKIGSIIKFANDTAMRCGEITGMRWERVDLNKGTVYLDDTKNGEARSVPLWLKTRALLRELGPLPSGLVWGAHEAVRSAWRRVKAAAIREALSAGNPGLAKSLRNLRFHDFRHEGTSRLVERTGWEDSHIQAVTGHKTSAMLARYTHLRSGDLADKMAVLEGGSFSGRAEQSERVPNGEDLPADTKLRIAWQAVSGNKGLLDALIKGIPIRDVAASFGVSDTAVHKACGRLGIVKPGRGHWARAENQTTS